MLMTHINNTKMFFNYIYPFLFVHSPVILKLTHQSFSGALTELVKQPGSSVCQFYSSFSNNMEYNSPVKVILTGTNH